VGRRMKIDILSPLSKRGLECVKDYEIVHEEHSAKAEIVYTHFNTFHQDYYPHLKYVLCPCTGIRHLDYLKDVEIINLTDRNFLYNSVWATAEHTVSLMLQACKAARKELQHSTVGFIGYGRVGQQVHKLLQSFSIKALVYDIDIKLFKHIGKIEIEPNMKNIFRNSDIITVHLPEIKRDKIHNTLSGNYIRKDTENLIDIDDFKLCNHRPIFINTSRSSIVDGRAILSAYYLNLIDAFGIDVMETYAKDIQIELEACCKGVVTPHIAGKTEESRNATDNYVFEKLLSTIRLSEVNNV
jgi:phosphoglycerate dehydrogenase-like enzyme